MLLLLQLMMRMMQMSAASVRYIYATFVSLLLDVIRNLEIILEQNPTSYIKALAEPDNCVVTKGLVFKW